jgi:Zn-dependent protease
VGVSPVVVAVADLYTWLLATHRFPVEQPGHSTTTYWLAGGAGALLLFLSLLVHEIGHGLVARDEGIGVRSMALTLLGGVTRMESSPPTAGAELRVSIIGPLASFAWGVTLLCLAYVTPGTGLPGLVGSILAWAGILNLILGAFNLMPASPLDGGKVLSSLIWLRTGDQALAMRWTARIGIAVGGGLGLLGLRDMRADDGGTFGIWFLLVGGFILMGAIREHQAAPLYGLLAGVTVADAMVPQPPVAPAGASIADFLRAARPAPEHRIYPVVGPDGAISGVLTADAIVAVPPERWEVLRSQDLAFPLERVSRVDRHEPLLPALQKVEGGDVQIGLVSDEHGRVVGTVDASTLHRTIEQRRAALVSAER